MARLEAPRKKPKLVRGQSDSNHVLTKSRLDAQRLWAGLGAAAKGNEKPQVRK